MRRAQKNHLLMSASENDNWLVLFRSPGPLLTSAVCRLYVLQGTSSQSKLCLRNHCYGEKVSCDKTVTCA